MPILRFVPINPDGSPDAFYVNAGTGNPRLLQEEKPTVPAHKAGAISIHANELVSASNKSAGVHEG